MARLRWVQAMLREWAAWIEGFGSELHSPALNDLPRGNFFDTKLPKETFSLRKTQQALDRLDPEYQEILMLVYIEGPRCNKVKLSEIARWKDVNERTFHHRVESAEAKFSQEIDFIENSCSEGE